MLMQKASRICLDHQIDFHFVPADVFAEREFYNTEITDKLIVNQNKFEVLVLPYAQFITPETAQAIRELNEYGGKVLIIDRLPDGLTNGESLPEWVRYTIVVPLGSLMEHLAPYRTVKLIPDNNRIRAMHYCGDEEVIYLFNEGDSVYEGTVQLPVQEPVCAYNAWDNRLEELNTLGGKVNILLQPSHSLLILSQKGRPVCKPLAMHGEKRVLTNFTQSVCRSIDYPNFGKHRQINALESYHLTDPKFSGFIRYDSEIEVDCDFVGLEISDNCEGIEVFVNGNSAGIQVVAPYRYDLTALCKPGKNKLTIEVATTLDREHRVKKDSAPTGLIGNVMLFLDT